MSLFTKSIDQIIFDDIKDFCDSEIPENIRLDYKSDFSASNEKKQIAKLVSAFANTQGGVHQHPKLVGAGRRTTCLRLVRNPQQGEGADTADLFQESSSVTWHKHLQEN